MNAPLLPNALPIRPRPELLGSTRMGRCEASRSAGNQVERATAPFGTASGTVHRVLGITGQLRVVPVAVVQSVVRVLERDILNAHVRGAPRRFRWQCGPGAMRRQAEAFGCALSPASQDGVGAARRELGKYRRHISVTRRASRRPWRRLARACAAPVNSSTHTVESRAAVRRIETEPTFRQATGERSIMHQAVVVTYDLPRHIANLDLGARGRFGARPPKGDPRKGSGLGTTGLPESWAEQ